MEMKLVTEEQPPMAKRVMVETAEGSVLFAKRVNDPTVSGGTRYIDDQSCPVRSPVVKWMDVVSQDATQ